jgi:hypothetical protein
MLVFLFTVTNSLAHVPIDTIFLVPANPTPTDSVTVKAVFVLPSSCEDVVKGMFWHYPTVEGDTLCNDTTCKYYLLQVTHFIWEYTFCFMSVRWDTISFSLGQLTSGEYWIDLLVVSYDLLFPAKVTTHDTLFAFSITSTKVNEEQVPVPGKFKLYQNYPNPFNPFTTIDYTVEKEGVVDLIMYNVLGQEVRTLINEKRQKGNYSVQWDGRNDKGEELPTGVYFYVLKVGNCTSAKKMLLLK